MSQFKKITLNNPPIDSGDDYVRTRFWVIDYPVLCYVSNSAGFEDFDQIVPATEAGRRYTVKKSVNASASAESGQATSLIFTNLADPESMDITRPLGKNEKFVGFVEQDLHDASSDISIVITDGS